MLLVFIAFFVPEDTVGLAPQGFVCFTAVKAFAGFNFATVAVLASKVLADEDFREVKLALR